MKRNGKILSVFLVVLMILASVPFGGFKGFELKSVAADEVEKITVEATFVDSGLAEKSAESAVAFFGFSEFEGCYGNQLSDLAREIYDSMVKQYVTDGKTGEYNYTFETPITFKAEISGGYIVMNDEHEAAETELAFAMQVAMDAFLYDHPEVFWLRLISSSYGISASWDSVNGWTGIIDGVTVTPMEIYSGASRKTTNYNTEVNKALAQIGTTGSRYDILKRIHDYICDNAFYNLISDYRVHSSEAFFIGNGGVVCEGYAKAFKVLCDRLEIPCVLVSGDAGGAHMWNYVQMEDGKWYLVDVTWDDQESRIYDTYFLANANTIGFEEVAISKERTERNDFSGTGIFSFTYPVLSTTAYTPHVHDWNSYYTIDVEPTCNENGSKSIHCKTCDDTKSVVEIPATGAHTYGNWVVDETDTKKMSRTCTVCGDVEESAVYLAGRSLLFKDIIQIRYYFDFSRFGDDVKSTGLLIWSEDEYKATDVHDINTAPYKMTNMTKRGNSDMYYGESAGVPAKNMIDNQYAIAYAELKDGTIEYTETCTFSPVVYCQTILAEGGNFEATMKNLAAALMNYGAAAQLHFKYKTDTLMNAWMADYLKEVAFDEALIQALPEIDDSKFTLTNDENIRKIGSSLTFVGNIMQNMYFDIENDDIANAREVKLLYWTESEYNKLDSLSYANARKSDLVYDETNSNKTGINCYRTVLEGVSAKDLRGAFMFAVYYKDAEGNEFYGPLFADGAHDYVRRVLITNTAATMKNLAKAFFMYHIAAEKHLLK